jgi:hypothetical protein
MGTAVDMRPPTTADDTVRVLMDAANHLEQQPEIEVGSIIVFHPKTPDPVFGDLFAPLAGRRFLVTSVLRDDEFGVVLLDQAGNESAILSVVHRSEAKAVPSRYALALAQTFRIVAEHTLRLDMDIPVDSAFGRILSTARDILPAVTA